MRMIYGFGSTVNLRRGHLREGVNFVMMKEKNSVRVRASEAHLRYRVGEQGRRDSN
jgi:hypothetical protein